MQVFLSTALVIQAGSFTLKSEAFIYIGRQKGKVQRIYLVDWRGFAPLFCTFKVLMYFLK